MDLLSQHEAFLRAVFDAPDDDTPRLVYADFLQENGEEERAEFIRVQCELAVKRGHTEYADRIRELGMREWELIQQLEPERKYWDAGEQAIHQRRGFCPPAGSFIVRTMLRDITAERWYYVRSESEVFGARSLAVEPGTVLRPEQIEALFTLPPVQRITEWFLNGNVREQLSHSGPGSFDLVELVQQPAITTRGVEALVQHRGARRITSLDLRNNDLDNDAARTLVKSPYLDNLKRLQLLEGNRLRGRVWQQVIERFGEDVVG